MIASFKKSQQCPVSTSTIELNREDTVQNVWYAVMTVFFESKPSD